MSTLLLMYWKLQFSLMTSMGMMFTVAMGQMQGAFGPNDFEAVPIPLDAEEAEDDAPLLIKPVAPAQKKE